MYRMLLINICHNFFTQKTTWNNVELSYDGSTFAARVLTLNGNNKLNEVKDSRPLAGQYIPYFYFRHVHCVHLIINCSLLIWHASIVTEKGSYWWYCYIFISLSTIYSMFQNKNWHWHSQYICFGIRTWKSFFWLRNDVEVLVLN